MAAQPTVALPTPQQTLMGGDVDDEQCRMNGMRSIGPTVDPNLFVYMYPKECALRQQRLEAYNDELVEVLKTAEPLLCRSVKSEPRDDDEAGAAYAMTSPTTAGAATSTSAGYVLRVVSLPMEGRENFVLGTVVHPASPEVLGKVVTVDITAISTCTLIVGQLFGAIGHYETRSAANMPQHAHSYQQLESRAIKATRLIVPSPLPLRRVAIKEAQRGTFGRFLVVTGPFRRDAPRQVLDSVLRYASDRHCSTVFVLGPLVPSKRREELLTYDRDYTTALEEAMDDLEEASAPFIQSGGKVVLLPSTDDVCCEPIIPQPCYDVYSETVTMASNPASFQFDGGVVVGATSADVMRHISGHACCKGYGMEARMRHIGEALVGTRLMAPLFVDDLSTPTMETSMMPQLAFADGATPHFIISPTQLPPQVHQLENGTVLLLPKKPFLTQRETTIMEVSFDYSAMAKLNDATKAATVRMLSC